jgi:hypothetical protein
MNGLIIGFAVSQMVFVAARLGIADALRSGPQTIAALARRVGAHPPFLYRLLRALAGFGVFAETATGRFRLTPLARTLCSHEPNSLHGWALQAASHNSWAAFSATYYGVKTGGLPFKHALGAPLFEYFKQHPVESRIFSAAMASLSGPENEEIARAYPFDRLSRVVDVGGAHGHLLATILRRHRKLKGVLFDLPHTVATAARGGFIGARDVSDRCEAVGGDFFAAVPPGADAYVMKYILHDWTDDQCVQILRNCRNAMAPGGRILVADLVIPRGNTLHPGKIMDVSMMVMTGGRERTREEFAEVFRRSALRLRRTYPVGGTVSIVEAVAA